MDTPLYPTDAIQEKVLPRLLIWQNVFRKRSREANSISSFHVPLRSCSLSVERRRVRKASESTRQEKRELMRLTKISRGGGEGNCEDERHQNTDDAFLSKTDQQPFFPFFQCFSFTQFLPLIDNKCVFSMTHWSHLMLLNISRGRPVSWRKSLPIFSEVCGKLNSGIKFPLSISLQYFHSSQLMGS